MEDEILLEYKQKISRRASHEMILLFAKHSNHYHDERFTTDSSVKRAFQGNNINYDQLVEKCRNPSESVPFFENLIGSTWTVSGGAKMARVNGDGQEEFSVSGPGKFTESTYWALIEETKKAKDRAVANISYSDLQSAIVSGIAGIESFVNQKVKIWNKAFPEKELIDNKANKVSFDDKINKWIPVLTNGKKLDKGTENWSNFKKLQRIRDNLAIHPKVQGYGFSYSDLVSEINMLNTGIAGVLIDLHLLFSEKIPGVIIRLRYSPEVKIKEKFC